MTLVVKHSIITGAPADPTAIVDGPTWDASHSLTGAADPSQGGTGTTTAFTQGSIVFAGATGVYSQDAALTWDNTLKKLNLNLSGSALAAAETNTGFQMDGVDGFATTIFMDSHGATAAIDFRQQGGTKASPVATATGATMGQINFQGWDGGAYAKSARVRAVAAPSGANWTGSDHGTDLAFFTNAPGTTSLSSKVRVKGDGTLAPETSDGAALGSTSLQWSDLFLASGGVLNYANGNYTVTHSSGALAFSGTISAPTLIVGASVVLPSPAIGVFTGNATTLPNPPSGTVLHVAGANSSGPLIVFDAFNSNSTVSFRTALTSAAAPSALTTGSVMMNFGAVGYGATGYSAGNRVVVRGSAAENWDDAKQGTFLQFFTTPLTTAAAVEAVRIQGSGGVTLGGTLTTDPGAGGMLANGVITSRSPIAGIGYSTGAGGTVTQATSKATAVTLNTVTGAITMNNAALAAATIVSFTVNDTAVAATDFIGAAHESGGTLGAYTINARATGAGTFAIDVRNNTAGSLSEAIVIRFFVHKSVNT